jgi:hypothetical protein
MDALPAAHSTQPRLEFDCTHGAADPFMEFLELFFWLFTGICGFVKQQI